MGKCFYKSCKAFHTKKNGELCIICRTKLNCTDYQAIVCLNCGSLEAIKKYLGLGEKYVFINYCHSYKIKKETSALF